MARERKANNAQSTLDGAINSSVTSLVVTDASSFPTNPQFRLKINDELLLVTAVAGTTFTVTRGVEGTTAVAHADDDTVTLVETQAGQVRHLRDWTNPLLEVNKPMQLLDASGNTLTASSFTNVNFGAATKTDLTGGSILLEHLPQSVENMALIVKSAPSPPWVFTVGFIANLSNEGGNFPACGAAIRDSATGEFYFHQITNRDEGLWAFVTKRNSPTSAPTGFLGHTNWSGASIAWHQIEDDNSDIIFRISNDGVNFLEFGKENRTTFLNPNQLGFVINNLGNLNIRSMATIVAWDES